ncbi:WD40/YVTN/BNR-like repeat-containing protein [Patescibacteria group bacterium]
MEIISNVRKLKMKKITQFLLVILIVFGFSGCSLLPSIGRSGSVSGGVLKSVDQGRSWEFKNKAGEESSIASLNILSMVINPNNPDNIFIGTEGKGVVVTDNGGENWRKAELSVERVYAIAIADSNIYVGGVSSKQGRIFRSSDNGETWNEIYVEPSTGTVITSILVSQNDFNVAYAGTSAGMIFKTVDGGETWSNLYKAKGPVTEIVFGDRDENDVYSLVFDKEVLVSHDRGVNFESLDKNGNLSNIGSLSIAVDKKTGSVYIGTKKGMYKTTDKGSSFGDVNILSSSKEFPIRSIAVNPDNSNNIIYSSQQVIYTSEDGGLSWSTFKFQSNGYISDIDFDPYGLGIIYATIRKSN